MKLRIALLGAATMASAASAALAPPQRTRPADRLDIATSAQLAPLVAEVAAAFEQANPGLKVTIDRGGSDVAMSRLYANQADLAIIGRVAADPEAKGFEWIYLHPPQKWPVMRGSIATPGHSPALAVIVNAANPVGAIDAAKLAALFREDKAPLWRDLGVTGPLGARPIRLYMPDSESGTGRFFRHALLNDSTQLAWDRITEVAEAVHHDGRDDDAGQRIAAMVARDPAGLAIGDAAPHAGTKVVGTPIDRVIYAYADKPGVPAVASFMAFLTGPDGRQLIAKSRYRPLD